MRTFWKGLSLPARAVAAFAALAALAILIAFAALTILRRRSPDVTAGGPPPSPEALIKEAYWNGWVNEQGKSEEAPRVESGHSYDVNFDLAAYDFALRPGTGAGGAAVDPAFLKELNDVTGPTLPVVVKPFLLGRGLELQEGRAQTLPLDLDLERLRKPPTDFKQDDPLWVFAEKVRALHVAIGVTANGPGCAAVGLSLWNAALNRPLDVVSRRIAVKDPNADDAAPRCESGSPPRIPSGRLVSLLGAHTGEVFEAALHVFDIQLPGADPVSTAVFMEKAQPEALSWKLPRPLGEFVGLAPFVNDLLVAREEKDYADLSRELTAILFPTRTGYAGDAPQDRAMRALRRLFANVAADAPPAVFARLVDARGKSYFLPLGLLALGAGKLLAQSVTVRQPLPYEEPARAGGCVAAWRMLLPEDLGAETVEKRFMGFVKEPPKDRMTSLDDLRKYVDSQPLEGAQGEGLLLLAHHAAGVLKTSLRSTASLLAENITRRFPPGSVAVLAACTTGQLSGENKGLPLVTQLSKNGLQAAILSPFSVDGPFGARFAFHFAHEVDQARDRREDPDLNELFRRTAQAVRQEGLVPFPDQSYEFVLAGDSTIRLCK